MSLKYLSWVKSLATLVDQRNGLASAPPLSYIAAHSCTTEADMTDNPALAKARAYLGLKEFPGAATNPTIGGWLARLKASWRDDETSWCGTFVAECHSEAGIEPVNGWAGARNWINFGSAGRSNARLCRRVLARCAVSGWQGHVGFVVGQGQGGNLMVLGGNQGDAVSRSSRSIAPAFWVIAGRPASASQWVALCQFLPRMVACRPMRRSMVRALAKVSEWSKLTGRHKLALLVLGIWAAATTRLFLSADPVWIGAQSANYGTLTLGALGFAAASLGIKQWADVQAYNPASPPPAGEPG
jgi:uncharacterized protein (TIGR02594 family)